MSHHLISPSSPATSRLLASLLLAATILILFGGCASVSVIDDRYPDSPPLATPPKIYLRPFTFTETNLRVDRQGPALEKFQREFEQRLAQSLQERLSAYIAPAEILSPDALPKTKGAWLIEGRITRLNQGSRALRTLLGFGLGGTKMEVETAIYSLPLAPLARRTTPTIPTATITTSGGSNAEPGGLFSPPFSAPLRLLAQSGHGLNRDIARTARMITAALQEELRRQGAPLPSEKKLKPKRPQTPPDSSDPET